MLANTFILQNFIYFHDFMIFRKCAIPRIRPKVGIDGPATNHKAVRIIQSSRSDAGLHMLIDIGTCSLHIVSGAFRTGDNCDDFWEIGEFLSNAYYMFY